MKNIKLLMAVGGLLWVLFPAVSHAQNLKLSTGANRGNLHRFYFYWGWNRGYYSASDIHFSGPGYDFTLEDVQAKDRQSPFSFRKYFHPSQLTIPQTNYGVGYFFGEKYSLSFGVDHMKYVVQQGQSVAIRGEIEGTGSGYDGSYGSGEEVVLQKNFLELEHTDGLNYLNVELNRPYGLPIPFKNLEINLLAGAGAGALVPRTDARLLGGERNNEYHLAGFGLSAKLGLQAIFFRSFFLRADLKAGYIDLPSVRTTPDKADKAEHDFFFLQPTLHLGGMFYLKKEG